MSPLGSAEPIQEQPRHDLLDSGLRSSDNLSIDRQEFPAKRIATLTREAPMSSIRTLVAPHDFSEHARLALDLAVEMAVLLDAELHLLHVLQPSAHAYGGELYAGGAFHADIDDAGSLRRATESQLQSVARRVEGLTRPVYSHVVLGARIADAIDAEAERLGADLIVMGTHGRTGLAHLLLGSVAEATLRQAPCPVLTVPRRKARVRASEAARPSPNTVPGLA